jgi:hypothetical protein
MYGTISVTEKQKYHRSVHKNHQTVYKKNPHLKIYVKEATSNATVIALEVPA